MEVFMISIPNKLIQAAVAVALIIATTGQLPRFIKAMQTAQYKLLKESKASNWGRPMLLPIEK